MVGGLAERVVVATAVQHRHGVVVGERFFDRVCPINWVPPMTSTRVMVGMFRTERLTVLVDPFGSGRSGVRSFPVFRSAIYPVAGLYSDTRLNVSLGK